MEAGRINALKIPSDPFRNRTCNLPACCTVPQPTVPPHTPIYQLYTYIKHRREKGIIFAL